MFICVPVAFSLLWPSCQGDPLICRASAAGPSWMWVAWCKHTWRLHRWEPQSSPKISQRTEKSPVLECLYPVAILYCECSSSDSRPHNTMSPMDNPTAVQTPSEGLRPSDPTVSPTQAEKDACRAFRATIVDFYSESSRPKLIARPTVYGVVLFGRQNLTSPTSWVCAHRAVSMDFQATRRLLQGPEQQKSS